MKIIEPIPRDRSVLYIDPGATPIEMGGHLKFGILSKIINLYIFIIIKIHCAVNFIIYFVKFKYNFCDTQLDLEHYIRTRYEIEGIEYL